jgi:hypothetical protein
VRYFSYPNPGGRIYLKYILHLEKAGTISGSLVEKKAAFGSLELTKKVVRTF